VQPFRIVEENLRVAMRCYADATPGGEVREYPGLWVTSCGVNIAVFNSGLLSAPSDLPGLHRAVSLTRTHFAARGFGWSFWLCDDLMQTAHRAAARSAFQPHGAALVAEPPGMYAESLALPSRPLTRIECRKVEDERTRAEFANISSVVFALPARDALVIYGGPRIWTGPMTGWIGYVNDEAVSIVTVVVAAGAAGVYSLGTMPQRQGCGYGEALLRHGLEHAQMETGVTKTVLESTEQGLRMYLRLGYRIVTRFSVYNREACDRL
jgi:ribosomal protein S18 acetylase RimI-like enzyme